MGTVHAKTLRPEDLMPGPDILEENPPVLEKEILLENVPAKVERIHVDGMVRTKEDIVAKHVKDIFTATNFEEMIQKAQVARMILEGLGIFKKVIINIDVSKGEKATPHSYDITYQVQEHKRITGGISTLVGTNEGSLVVSMKLPNTFGRGEKFNMQYLIGTKKNMGYSADFSKPLQGDPQLQFTSNVYQQSGDFPQSGFKDIERGVGADLSFPTFLGSHNLRYEGVWRELSCLSDATAFAVREQCGHSLKSSLKHTWAKDKRDHKVLPTKGYLLKATQELAGLGGDANFVKHELEMQYNLPLILDSVFQVTVAGGLMKTIKPGSNIHIQDRFFLGGPLTLRGYRLKGVGPHQDGCALGANSYCGAGVHLFTPLPFRPGKGGFGDLFRTHFFLTAGNIKDIDFNENWRNHIRDLAHTLRWSYGAGITLKMGGIARLELNYTIPMNSQQGDKPNHGVEFGIGMNFL